MQRIWGGRKLNSVYNRSLPDSQLYGESWEISDRENEQSIVSGGKYDGLTLNTLWRNHQQEVFGESITKSARFPLLIKILDASKDLSIQVHPPQDKAIELGGDAKNEFWYISEVEKDAKLYVGLKKGVTKSVFEKAIEEGNVEEYVHEINAKKDDFIYIPSGRLHAIGAGFLIYEIQQNSDTTFRVFDWNRIGLDGKLRNLHVKESLDCINFDDHEPQIQNKESGILLASENFIINKRQFATGESVTPLNSKIFCVWMILDGTLESKENEHYQPGDFTIAPVNTAEHLAKSQLTLLEVTIPQ